MVRRHERAAGDALVVLADVRAAVARAVVKDQRPEKSLAGSSAVLRVTAYLEKAIESPNLHVVEPAGLPMVAVGREFPASMTACVAEAPWLSVTRSWEVYFPGVA